MEALGRKSGCWETKSHVLVQICSFRLEEVLDRGFESTSKVTVTPFYFFPSYLFIICIVFPFWRRILLHDCIRFFFFFFNCCRPDSSVCSISFPGLFQKPNVNPKSDLIFEMLCSIHCMGFNLLTVFPLKWNVFWIANSNMK